MIWIIVIVVGLVAALVLSMIHLLAPPDTPPAYTGEKPQIDDIEANYVAHTEEIVIDVPLAQYLEWSARTSLNDLLQGSDGLPGVVRTEMISGIWSEIGARRRVVLSDGHFAVEEVLADETMRLFRYQVWGYTNFARFAVDYAIGEFQFFDEGDQTRIVWTYSFHKGTPLADVFLPSFVSGSWAGYMRQAVQAMKTGSEQAASTPG